MILKWKILIRDNPRFKLLPFLNADEQQQWRCEPEALAQYAESIIRQEIRKYDAEEPIAMTDCALKY